MANAQQVLAILKQHVNLTQEQYADVLPLCLTALEELRGRLRPKANEGDVRVLNAAAAMALCRWQLRESIREPEMTFMKAGDITVRGQGLPFAQIKTLREEALLAAAPLLEDSGFFFRSVL